MVFVGRSNDLPRSFIGTVTPDKVRWALSQQFPWLETAFATAYLETVGKLPDSPAFICSNSGALDSWNTTQLIQHFLQDIQSEESKSGWISLSQSGKWEHASWIDRIGVESYFCDVLQRSWVTASAGRSQSAIVKAVVQCHDQFVALLEPSGQFTSLVDRYSVMEQMTQQE